MVREAPVSSREREGSGLCVSGPCPWCGPSRGSASSRSSAALQGSLSKQQASHAARRPGVVAGCFHLATMVMYMPFGSEHFGGGTVSIRLAALPALSRLVLSPGRSSAFRAPQCRLERRELAVPCFHVSYCWRQRAGRRRRPTGRGRASCRTTTQGYGKVVK